MDRLQSTPPVLAMAPVLLGLLLGSLYLLAPLIRRGEAPSLLRLSAAMLVVVALAVGLLWLALARKFVVAGESLRVHRISTPWMEQTFVLNELTGVGVVGHGLLSHTVIEASFRGGARVQVPRYYTNSALLFRCLFSRLGANLAAKTEA